MLTHLFRFIKVVLCIILVLACLLGIVLIDDMTVSLEQVDYYDDQITPTFFGYRILLISDFHDSFYYNQIADIVKREKPDVVLFLGDMTEILHQNWNNTLNLLDRITEDTEVYGVLGNHEVLRDECYRISEDLTAHGLKLLNNEKVELERNGEYISLIGVRDITDTDAQLGDGTWLIEQMRLYLNTVTNKKEFTLLACHRANLYPYLKDANINLMLSGHIHGGVIRVPFIGGLRNVDGTMMPKYDKGFYDEGNMKMFVSSGCDFRVTKLRLFNSPSVTMITLKR